jgi:hypothetical protein
MEQVPAAVRLRRERKKIRDDILRYPVKRGMLLRRYGKDKQNSLKNI